MCPCLMSPVVVYKKLMLRKKKEHKKIIFNKNDEKEFKNLLSKLGETVKSRRKELGFTQEDMENEPNPIEPRHFRRIEAGTNTTVKMLYILSKKLDISIKDLFDT